jgi:hypothetical protein
LVVAHEADGGYVIVIVVSFEIRVFFEELFAHVVIKVFLAIDYLNAEVAVKTGENTTVVVGEHFVVRGFFY